MTEQEKYNYWLEQENIDQEVLNQLKLMEGNENEIFESFYKDLEFGTAGLRGILGAGTNRMNIYTVGKASEGFAKYLKENFKSPSIAIAYDSRINSELFAWVSARIMAKNGIKVYIYSELMPTPMLSYALRHYKCDGGIVITASHNPAKYNGYKVYGPDGCQAGPEMADAILTYINKTDMFKVELADKNDKNINIIPDSVVEGFVDAILKKRVYEAKDAVKNLNIVYTPLNGTGRRPVDLVMKKMGVKNISVVKEQEMPDGNFPTCSYPNPEIREALEKGLELLEKTNGDILIATDPDADRVGVAVKHNGDFRLITGNEMGVLMLDYICRAKTLNGTMPKNPVAVKTIVTTAMVDAVTQKYGVKLESVLTGFKFIGGVIAELEENNRLDDYLLGFEESYGYLFLGEYVRDKDAISAVMLIADMTAYYKSKGKTLVDVLEDMFKEFGYYENKTVTFAFEGASGLKKMASIMEQLRQAPPKSVAGADIIETSDYKLSITKNKHGETPILLPKSNVLAYKLSDGCSFVVRPSGTEPKLKIYMFVKGESQQKAKSRVEEMYSSIKTLIQ
ncbi:MAG: phospho-sugar mutase [Clostridiales bacterium]|nr:phospho-sugar mutase [Clostridiales bacterium]